ncbi:hypothetical protein IFM89_023249 [Coptis chinensis]|uniref:Stigma-specific Stig1 family protein n=1 Tax=Coptis chinensis TaxID=261450 RepID=A0A835HWU9_9MAGN|nr:hypothetical protein IFM89_023249 [Coptis chinensis]
MFSSCSRSNGASVSLLITRIIQCYPLILCFMIGAFHGVDAIRGMHSQTSDTPTTHSNFLHAALRGGQKHFWCASNPTVCLDREKNPWGGSTCCFQRFCKDTMNDRNHCGKCGMRCAHGLVCCGGRCVDIRNDPHNCGSCYEECPGQVGCSFAMCGYSE